MSNPTATIVNNTVTAALASPTISSLTIGDLPLGAMNPPQTMNPNSNQSPSDFELNSTNVFAFGLHPSYGAFANEPNGNNNVNNANVMNSSAQLTSLVALGNGMNMGFGMPMNLDSLNNKQWSNPANSNLHAPSMSEINAINAQLSSPLLIPNMPGTLASFPSHFTLNAVSNSQQFSANANSRPNQMSDGSGLSANSAEQQVGNLSSMPSDFNPYFYMNNLNSLNFASLSNLSAVPGSPYLPMPGMPLPGQGIPQMDPLSLNQLSVPMMNGLGNMNLNYSMSNGGNSNNHLQFQNHNNARALSHMNNPSNGNNNSSICKFYAQGHCSRGTQCSFAHINGPNSQGHHGPNRSRGRDNVRRGGSNRGGGNRNGNSRDMKYLNPDDMSKVYHGSMNEMDGSSRISPIPPIVPDQPLTIFSQLNGTAQTFPSAGSPDTRLDMGGDNSLLRPLNGQVGANELALATTVTNAAELTGRVYALAKDQFGCRLLQQLLHDGDERTPGILALAYTETFPHINDLMTDPFGNYLCQKLIECCTDQQRLAILEKVSSDLVEISLNLHGTRAVQKLVETLNSPEQIHILVNSLQSSVVTLIKDLNGNHVVQKCLHHLSPNDNQFIFDAVSEHCVSVATHKHGCCVLQRCLDYATTTQKRQLMNEVVANALELVQDAFGNYVVQYVLSLGEPQSISAIITNLLGHICALSVQKFSSNVIEKCVARGSDISLTTGLTRPIEACEISSSNSSQIFSINTKRTGITMSMQSALLRQGVKSTSRLTFEDGRTLNCTSDHLLLSTTQWKRAQELIPGESTVTSSLIAIKDVASCEDLGFIVHGNNSFTITIDSSDSRDRALAYVRLTGVVAASNASLITVSHIVDRDTVLQDVRRVFGIEMLPYYLNINGDWIMDISSVMSFFTDAEIPSFLKDSNCPFALKREYIATVFGLNGSIQLTGNLSFTLLFNCNVDQTISLLLGKQGIACINGAISNLESIYHFSQLIGARYSVQKSSQLGAIRCALNIQKSKPAALDFIFKRLGCWDWFSQSSTAFTNSYIPSIQLLLTKIEDGGMQEVFDLTVDVEHSFVANGFVVHNCLELANDKIRMRMVEELINVERLPRLLQDPYANYVIQKALTVSKKSQLDRLVAVIKPHLPQLRNTAFGKRIQTKIQKKFPDLIMDPSFGFIGSDELSEDTPTMSSMRLNMSTQEISAASPFLSLNTSDPLSPVCAVGSGFQSPRSTRSAVGPIGTNTNNSPPPTSFSTAFNSSLQSSILSPSSLQADSLSTQFSTLTFEPK